MPRDASNNFALLFLGALFALPLLLALFAPTAAAQGESADVAGYEIYGSVGEEVEHLRSRAQEFRVKGDGFQEQVKNDEAESGRLKMQADKLRAKARKLDESAASARKQMADAAARAALNHQMANNLKNIVGQWKCVFKAASYGEKAFRVTEAKADAKRINVETWEQHGIPFWTVEIFSDYNFNALEKEIFGYTFSREKKIEGQGYEFQIKAARIFSGTLGGKWTMFGEDGGRLVFTPDEGATPAQIDDIGDPETTVHATSWLGDKPVRNWDNISDLRAEALNMQEEVEVVFWPPLQTQYEPEENRFAPSSHVLSQSLSSWRENCKKAAR